MVYTRLYHTILSNLIVMLLGPQSMHFVALTTFRDLNMYTMYTHDTPEASGTIINWNVDRADTVRLLSLKIVKGQGRISEGFFRYFCLNRWIFKADRQVSPREVTSTKLITRGFKVENKVEALHYCKGRGCIL